MYTLKFREQKVLVFFNWISIIPIIFFHVEVVLNVLRYLINSIIPARSHWLVNIVLCNRFNKFRFNDNKRRIKFEEIFLFLLKTCIN